MGKKDWCVNYDCGRCKVRGLDVPSLAKIESREVHLEPEKRVLTDRNSILNFLHMYELWKEGAAIPKEVTITIPRIRSIKYLKCTASNSRSKQRQCSHY